MRLMTYRKLRKAHLSGFFSNVKTDHVRAWLQGRTQIPLGKVTRGTMSVSVYSSGEDGNVLPVGTPGKK